MRALERLFVPLKFFLEVFSKTARGVGQIVPMWFNARMAFDHIFNTAGE